MLSPLYAHQLVGLSELTKLDDPSVGRRIPGVLMLADEMGLGKTRQVIEAAQHLYRTGWIKRAIVVAPAPVRQHWCDPEFGELARYLYPDVPSKVTEFSVNGRLWCWLNGQVSTSRPPRSSMLEWFVTNYEYIRAEARTERLLDIADERTLLVLDESSAIKNYRSQQSQACLKIRGRCGWVWLLNGTPVANNPGDLYHQFYLMHPSILGCKNWWVFRARYAEMGGWQGKQITGWRGIEDLQERVRPYVLRRLKADCLDLPPKLPPVTLSVPLHVDSWRVYKELRDELVVWLNENQQATAAQAGSRVLRLAQICSGFLGGITEQSACVNCEGVGSRGDQVCLSCGGSGIVESAVPPQQVGSEKADMVSHWFEDRLSENPTFRCVLWHRFRWELDLMADRLAPLVNEGRLSVGVLQGGQRESDRTASLRLLDPRTAPSDRAVVVLGTLGTGAVGLNLSAANTMVYVSQGYSLYHRLQSMDRVHRPGQIKPVSYFDVVATGPAGQRTVDHAIVHALQSKDDMARWTTSAWVRAIQ